MNKTNSLLIPSVALMILFLFSCEKDNDGVKPGKSAPFGKLEIVHGDKQSGYFGEFLTDSIVIKASSFNSDRKYLIKCEITQGNGSIEHNYLSYGTDYYVDSRMPLGIRWRLGCDYNTQKVRLYLYVDSIRDQYGHVKYFSTPSDSLTITANAIKPKGCYNVCELSF